MRRAVKNCVRIVGMLVCIGTLSGCGDDLDAVMPLWSSGTQKEQDKQQEKQPQGLEDIAEKVVKEEAIQPEPTETTQPEGMEQSNTQEETTITISAVGDVTLGNHHMQDYAYSFRQTFDTVEDEGYFFENVYDIFSADDMTLVNLEGVFTLSEQINEGRTYNIKGDPEYVKILTAGSVEAVSMGNNHRLDYGEEGSRDTVEALESEGIVYAYDNNIGIYETKGIRIGYVSVNEASQGKAVEKIMQNGIDKLKEEGVDLILACCHWGTEREYYPEEYQQTFGRLCIDWGADLVIGHHPHVLQGIEEYQGKYIIYSLGNFCFGANRNPSDKDTMIFTQTFTFVEGEKTEDTTVRIIPCSLSSVATRNDFKPTVAVGEEAERIINKINDFSREYGVEFDKDGYIAGKVK